MDYFKSLWIKIKAQKEANKNVQKNSNENDNSHEDDEHEEEGSWDKIVIEIINVITYPWNEEHPQWASLTMGLTLFYEMLRSDGESLKDFFWEL